MRFFRPNLRYLGHVLLGVVVVELGLRMTGLDLSILSCGDPFEAGSFEVEESRLRSSEGH